LVQICFPYTTLFRSWHGRCGRNNCHILLLFHFVFDEFVFTVTEERIRCTNGPRNVCASSSVHGVFGKYVDRLFRNGRWDWLRANRKSTRLNSSHVSKSYAVFCLKKKNITFFYS